MSGAVQRRRRRGRRGMGSFGHGARARGTRPPRDWPGQDAGLRRSNQADGDRAPMKERQLLRDMFEAAIAAASPDKAVPANLPEPPAGRTVVVGAGKAAASMARAVEAHWPDDKPLSGLVVTRYGHGVGPLKRIEVVEAAHPIPDAAGQNAAQQDPRSRQGPRPGRPCALPDIGRRLCLAFACRRRESRSTTSRP